jgi:hypothetical protein
MALPDNSMVVGINVGIFRFPHQDFDVKTVGYCLIEVPSTAPLSNELSPKSRPFFKAPSFLRHQAYPEGRPRFSNLRALWLQVGSIGRSIFLVKDHLFGRPVSTFPDHALGH